MVSKGNIRRIFPGGNTYKGFHSFYDNIILSEEANRIFCIKGGPGVGKSSFMKSIASEFLNLGCDLEMHHCSSDPGSLDAIVIKQAKVAILDGTTPHAVDPKNPGAVDEILCFGDFWKTAELEKLRDLIIELNKEKKSCFNSAYQYLKCAKVLQDDIEKNAKIATDKAKLRDMILKLRSELIDNIAKANKTGRERHLFHSALTSEGKVTYIDTLIADNFRCYLIEGVNVKDKSDLLSMLSYEYILKGYDVEIYHQPLNPDRIETLIIDSLNLALTTDISIKEKANKIIDLNEIMIPEKLSFRTAMIEKDVEMIELLQKEAFNRFKSAKLKHEELEKLYIPQMDFNAVTEFMISIIKRIKEYL